MSDHVWAQENIAAYVAGGLDPAEAERLEQHAAECPNCARLVADARSVEEQLAPVLAIGNPGPALEDRVLRALAMAPLPARSLRLSARGKIAASAAAVVLLAAVGAGANTLMEHGGLYFPSLGTPRMAMAVKSPEADGKVVFLVDDSVSIKGVRLGEVPILLGADEMARELRENTVAPLAKSRQLGRTSAVSGDPASTTGTFSGLPSAYGGASPPTDAVRGKAPAPAQGPSVLSAPGAGPGGGGGAGLGGGGMPANTFNPPVAKPQSALADIADGESKKAPLAFWSYSNNGTLPALRGFFKPGDTIADLSDKNQVTDSKALKDNFRDQSPEQRLGFGRPSAAAGAQPSEPAAKRGEGAQKTEAPAELPSAPRKIIIRTGELEFEIDSYDAGVATIMKLITATKGSFIATINSEKLANGKVRGSVVVRVPPELLDGFVLELRKELTKSGELKSQRVGSLDITKQYTDLESRLRAARGMEERLLAIIKEGKGQIKDLLAAEKELGVWRTQIESIEGELRYYGNQAALSTLTIKLAEKDIRMAASVTESERVQAGLEVEDVEKAHQEALKAILDAKGRVSRSELKQHAAGQFNAILHFEVAPDAAGPMRDRLKQLGTMVRLQVDRIQQTEGGGPAPKDGKIERGPTQFMVSIYNLANVAPRETVILRVAATDVGAVYQKLRDVVNKAKGQVIAANLDEKDRQNINAQLDFFVSRLGESEILAALTAAGETLSRQVSRAPASENVTDAKVLFRLAVVDADSIQPRETVVIKIAAADVPAAYHKLREAVVKAKARVLTAQVNEQDRRNINAQLDFTARRADEAPLQAALTTAGEILSRQATRLPESPNLTDAKVFFQIALLDVDAVPARETVTVKVAAPDVAASYQKLRDAVAQVKGRTIAAQINEQDRRNITAQLEVTIRRDDAKVLEGALADAGETLSRLVSRAAESANATDAKVHAKIDLVPAAGIAPRETTTLALEVADVGSTLTLFNDQVKAAQGRTVETQIGQERSGQVSARVMFDVPLNEAATLVEKFKAAGHVRVHQVTRDPQAPEGKLALGRLVVTVSNTPLIGSDQGLWPQVRSGLAISLRGLSISVGWLVIGLLFVLPWAVVLYALVWLVRRLWRAEPAHSAAPGGSVASPPAVS